MERSASIPISCSEVRIPINYELKDLPIVASTAHIAENSHARVRDFLLDGDLREEGFNCRYLFCVNRSLKFLYKFWVSHCGTWFNHLITSNYKV